MKAIIAVTAICVFASSSAAIAEKQVKKSDMPAAVQKTADEQSTGATVLGYAKDVEKGKVEYEVALKVNGHSKDVTMDQQGNVTEVEEQVDMDSLPASVRDGLQKRSGSGRITKIESLTKHGSIVAYEAQVMTGGKHSEIQIGPEGQKLNHEE